jgi:YHS domain-containing protein
MILEPAMKHNIDPVCGKRVADDTPHHVEHAGQHFHFCSMHCLDKFQENPAAYIKPDQRETQHLSRGRWMFYGFLAVAGFFLFMEHRAHVLGVLPYLFLLACPLMHMFMHHGHGRHDHYDSSKGESK